MRVLVLGGTSEAAALARLLAVHPGMHATISLAGRTSNPAPLPLPVRVGGFGGAIGLADYLAAERIDALVDATHPFAGRISVNAAEAAQKVQVPLVALVRPPWAPVAGDRWTVVDDLNEAATAIGAAPRRVFLTVGRLGVAAFAAAPQHTYLVRSIDDPVALPLPKARVILDRPPFDREGEAALMRDNATEVLVTKNSGGAATYGKIAAARDLGLPVIVVRPPARPEVQTLTDPAEVMAWLEAHARADRGV